MDSTSHAILLAQVRKLEEALSSIRADLQGVTDCKGRCEQLDSLHDTVSHMPVTACIFTVAFMSCGLMVFLSSGSNCDCASSDCLPDICAGQKGASGSAVWQRAGGHEAVRFFDAVAFHSVCEQLGPAGLTRCSREENSGQLVTSDWGDATKAKWRDNHAECPASHWAVRLVGGGKHVMSGGALIWHNIDHSGAPSLTLGFLFFFFSFPLIRMSSWLCRMLWSSTLRTALALWITLWSLEVQYRNHACNSDGLRGTLTKQCGFGYELMLQSVNVLMDQF